jgi:hypothetical protein
MAANNPAVTLTAFEGVAKRIHGKVQDLEPTNDKKFTKRFKLDKDNLVGKEYYEPVFLTGEHGFTATGNSGDQTTLNGAEVTTSKPASVNPYNYWYQTRAVIDSLARIAQEGEKSFVSAVTKMMTKTKLGMDKRMELVHLYGTYPLATLSSATDASTTSVMTITAASWAPRTWLGMRNAKIDAYNGSTKLNTTSDLNITVVNPKDRKITVTGAAADIDAIVAVGTSGSGVTLYLKGLYGNTGAGVRDICKLSTGSLFGISADTYNDYWCATQVTWDSSTTPFTWTILNDGVEEAAGRGLERDLVAAVPYAVFTTLSASIDALRMFDESASVSKVELGHKQDAITYQSLVGKITVEPSGFIPSGEVWCYPQMNDGDDALKIIGSQAPTFTAPGGGEEMAYMVTGANGAMTNAMEWAMFTCQSLFTTCPRDFIYFGG